MFKRSYRDTRDSQHRQRFLPWRPEQHFYGDLMKSFIMDPVEHRGYSIFHGNLIAMHHLTPNEIRLIHGMLYGVGPSLERRRQQIKKSSK